ncbi:MAG: CRISPR-associated endonuclease Cas2 [Phascolarctobacterium sp.]|nr:CRISPR-associated endonuclease Cas2 [Phascolarctobacterium sp.]
MLVLITYDVNTQDAAGVRRLNKIAKLCVKYGQRVQNSVFECMLENHDYKILQNELLKLADLEKDSLRFYNLGQKYASKIEHFGVKATYDPQESLLI